MPAPMGQTSQLQNTYYKLSSNIQSSNFGKSIEDTNSNWLKLTFKQIFNNINFVTNPSLPLVTDPDMAYTNSLNSAAAQMFSAELESKANTSPSRNK